MEGRLRRADSAGRGRIPSLPCEAAVSVVGMDRDDITRPNGGSADANRTVEPRERAIRNAQTISPSPRTPRSLGQEWKGIEEGLKGLVGDEVPIVDPAAPPLEAGRATAT